MTTGVGGDGDGLRGMAESAIDRVRVYLGTSYRAGVYVTLAERRRTSIASTRGSERGFARRSRSRGLMMRSGNHWRAARVPGTDRVAHARPGEATRRPAMCSAARSAHDRAGALEVVFLQRW